MQDWLEPLIKIAIVVGALQGAVAAGILGCGSVVLGSSEAAGQFLAEVAQRGAKAANPEAAISGPMIRGSLGPYRETRPPDQRERRNISRIKGREAAPVAVAE